ncbi:diaphanous family protein [Entamoeba histolytica KU27]|uniref:Diaphanous family protein n=1 Tax=Entamoeba histolytica KU27 TaxID=885311 RepID=M2S5N9_ENTHI|nr:diaphanous family protein [Entamoeba histolytica KU27]
MQQIRIILDIGRPGEERPTLDIKATSIQDAIDQSVQHFCVEGVFILTDMEGIPLNQLTFPKIKTAIMTMSPAFVARQSILKIKKATNEVEKEKAINEIVKELQNQTYAREFFKTTLFPPPFNKQNIKIIKVSMRYKDAIKLMLNDKYIQELYNIMCTNEDLEIRLQAAEVLNVLCMSGGEIFIIYAAKVFAAKRDEYKYRSLLPMIGNTKIGATVVALLLGILKCSPEGRKSKIVMDFKYVGITEAVKKLKSYKLLVTNFEKALKDDCQIINYDQRSKREWKRVEEIRQNSIQLENRIKTLYLDKERALKSKEELSIILEQKKQEIIKCNEDIKFLKEHTEVRNNISITIRKLTRIELIEEIAKTNRDIELFTKEKERLLNEIEDVPKEKKKVIINNFIEQNDKEKIKSIPRGNFISKRITTQNFSHSKINCLNENIFNQPKIELSVYLPELKWNRIILKPDHPKCLWDCLPEKKLNICDVENSFKIEEQNSTNPVISRYKYIDLCVLRNKFPSSVSLGIDINNFYYRQITERDGKFLIDTLKGIHLNELDYSDGGKGIEGWLKPLLEIPAFQIKLKMWVESMLIENEINRITPLIQNCFKAIEVVKSSRSFKELINIILVTGNYLNSDYPSIRCADGFQIDLLIKLRETRLPQKQVSMLDFVIKIHSNPEQLIEELSISSFAKIDLTKLINDIKELIVKCSSLKQIIQTQIISLPSKQQSHITEEVNTLMSRVIYLRDFIIKTAKKFYQMMYWIIGIPAVAVEYNPITFFGILEQFTQQLKESLEDKTELKPSVTLINRAFTEMTRREKHIHFGSQDDLLAKVICCLKKGKIKASILRKILN